MREHRCLGCSTCERVLGLLDACRFGPRFPYLTDAYDRHLRLCAWRVAQRLGLVGSVREGISLIQCGPSLETPAELRMMRMLGADVVGQSYILFTTFTSFLTLTFQLNLG